jgi:hypothetical protein
MTPIKVQPLGICDLCGNAMPTHTHHGVRIYCSIDCRNTANSRAGSPVRSAKAKKRVALGQWKNPALLISEEQRRQQNAESARKGRKREVAEGRWRNPALSDRARKKLSRPRVHKYNWRLHRALALLRKGTRLPDLPCDLRSAVRTYRRKLRANHREEWNARAREKYRQRKH